MLLTPPLYMYVVLGDKPRGGSLCTYICAQHASNQIIIVCNPFLPINRRGWRMVAGRCTAEVAVAGGEARERLTFSSERYQLSKFMRQIGGGVKIILLHSVLGIG